MNILFTCGGTAGHVNPAVALARIFQERHPDCKVLFVGADGGMETRLVPKEGYEIRTVTITNFHRSFKPKDIVHNVGTLINMQKSRAQARRILDQFKPDLVVGTGNSLPTQRDRRRPGQRSPGPEAPVPSLLPHCHGCGVSAYRDGTGLPPLPG